ncbi:nitroreductase [Rasiella rasia]|uniref:Putative NAD(P)H nitroreductase n=1 Tax=Rasiella rasia TaxID=2744027 RepID=A0A6G6GLV4_9FLAO|nr:nitroreductase [Rasiella rasia]QIE59470.1 nitroreductase [Rasiella rasia]
MLAEIIKNRRSIYPDAYTNQPITKSTVQTILDAANWAPTHKKTEPWRFKVFHSESSREQLSAFLGEAYVKMVENPSDFKRKKIEQKAVQSGCVIAICMQRDPDARIPEWEEIASVAMAVQNMWLTAHHLNIGAYWSSPGLIKLFGEHVALAEGERCIGFFYMGYFNDNSLIGIRNTPIEDKIQWI